MGEGEIERLKQLLKKPDNKTCADCNTKQPRWASINLGCFICIRCSGIHRSIGVHVSKVRSVTLDEWQPAWVNNMEQWGNKKVNHLYEAKVGNVRKPDATTSDREVEQFIRQKYEHRAFMAKGTTRKSKVEADSSQEDSQSEESESSGESEQSEQEKVAAMPLPKPINNKLVSRRTAPNFSQSKDNKPNLESKLESVKLSSANEQFAKFDQSPATAQALSASESTDFGQFSEFLGAESQARSSGSSAPNDKDFIMSLFQSTPASQADAARSGPGGPYGQTPPSGGIPNGQAVLTHMAYGSQMMQGAQPVGFYPPASVPATYATIPSYSSNAPLMNTFGAAASNIGRYPPQTMNAASAYQQPLQQQDGFPFGHGQQHGQAPVQSSRPSQQGPPYQ